jgi:hypothetical protein
MRDEGGGMNKNMRSFYSSLIPHPSSLALILSIPV